MKYSISPVNHYNKFIQFTSGNKKYLINTNPIAEFKDSVMLNSQAHIEVTKEHKEFYDSRGYLIQELIEGKQKLVPVEEMKKLNTLSKWYKVNPVFSVLWNKFIYYKNPTKYNLLQEAFKGIDKMGYSFLMSLLDTLHN